MRVDRLSLITACRTGSPQWIARCGLFDHLLQECRSYEMKMTFDNSFNSRCIVSRPYILSDVFMSKIKVLRFDGQTRMLHCCAELFPRSPIEQRLTISRDGQLVSPCKSR